MNTHIITNHTELQHRVMQLKNQRAEQEEKIVRNCKELYYTYNPMNLIKNGLRNLVSDSEVRHDAAKIGIDTVADFVLGRIFGRNSSIKGYVTSLVLGKVANYAMNNWSDSIYTGISKVRNYMSDYFKSKDHKHAAE